MLELESIIKNTSHKSYALSMKNIYGLDIKPQYPSKPHIVINNNFNKSVENISKDLVAQIKKITRFK